MLTLFRQSPEPVHYFLEIVVRNEPDQRLKAELGVRMRSRIVVEVGDARHVRPDRHPERTLPKVLARRHGRIYLEVRMALEVDGAHPGFAEVTAIPFVELEMLLVSVIPSMRTEEVGAHDRHHAEPLDRRKRLEVDATLARRRVGVPPEPVLLAAEEAVRRHPPLKDQVVALLAQHCNKLPRRLRHLAASPVDPRRAARRVAHEELVPVRARLLVRSS